MLIDNYQIVGRLGADPELSKNGKNTIMFSICITKKINGEKTSKWVQCYISDKSHLKNIASYLKKGMRVLISGSPFASHYLKENKIHDVLSMNVFGLVLLDGNKEDTEFDTNDFIEEGIESIEGNN